MTHSWGIDLGTTNSSVARWDENRSAPVLIHFDTICREEEPEQQIEVKYSIPSSVYITPSRRVWTFLDRIPFIRHNFFTHRKALIGMEAINRDSRAYNSAFVPGFKAFLQRDSYRVLTRVGKKLYTAREIASFFVRELLYHIKEKSNERARNIAFTVPVDCYEPYRAQLKLIAQSLGIRKFKTIDEPVAAAIGYGLRMDEGQFVLVIDFGGGTLDMALIEISERATEAGRCRVVAKSGAPVGGDLVDEWLVRDFCENAAYDLEKHSRDPDIQWWYRMMKDEACRVKENLFFKEEETFLLTPPEEMQSFEARVFSRNTNLDKPFRVTKDHLINLLEKRGLYSVFNHCLEDVLSQSRSQGIGIDEIQEVLMVGGSTLLPRVYSRVEKTFGRDRVRAWQPFGAVAFGASVYAADRMIKSDFITHDYAFVTHNSETREKEYNIIVPRGTPFPTGKDFWKRHLTPTCPLGEPEKIFKLVICEIGKRHMKNQEFVWDSMGNLHTFKEGDENKPIIVPLNELNPVLGTLMPPHSPSDRSARLEISFVVNSERWLCTTVFDLKTRKYLLTNSPVIRIK